MTKGHRSDRAMHWRAVLRVAALAVGLVSFAASDAGAAAPRSVLLVYADPRLVPAVVAMDETLRATIGSRAVSPIQFYTEYLDLSWFPRGQEHHISQAMREKYTGRRFDLIVPCGDAALSFALRERDTLFPGVPIVFCTVEDDLLGELTLPPDVTGVTMLRDWAAGLDLVLRLHPDVRRIAFVGGAGAVEREWEGLARKAFARYEGRLTFTYLTGLPMKATVAAVASLPPDSVVLFNVFLLDGAGRSFSSPEALARLAPVAKVPIYGYAETQLGHGIVGGPLVSYTAQASRAAELAVRVLGGERLGPGDIVRREASRFMFDARQLARWGIAERTLPPDSVVRFGTPSFWQQYRWHLLGVVTFIAAETLLVIALLLVWRRHTRVRRGLDERLRFETILADLAAAYIAIPVREIDGRIGRDLGRIMDELGLDRIGLAEFNSARDELRVTHAWSHENVVVPPGHFTAEFWPWTLGRLASGETVCVTRLADLPAEAVADRRSFTERGTRSFAMLPLVVGGTVSGAFACIMVQREREWPEELVKRLRLLADVFGVVLMRRRADRALAESEGRFQALADAAPVMMWMAGADGRCTDFNRPWLDFTGRTLREELGDGWLEGVHPDDRESCLASYLTALAARRPFTIEYRLRGADGVYRDIVDNGVPRFDADRAFLGYVGSAIDVSEMRAAQRAVVDSLALRSAILGSLYGQVAAVDRTGVIIAVNESWARSLSDMGGNAATAGVGANYLEVCRRAVAAGDLHAPAALEAIEGVLSGRTPQALLEYSSVTPAGVKWYAMIVETFKRREGGLVISHIDVTRRRRAEEDAQRERGELAHALRVATLGELASSLAHEINQPLAAIASNAQAGRRLLESAGPEAELPRVLQDIADDALRAAQVIRRLRVLFKKEQGERQPVDMSEVIKEVIGLLHKDLERRRVRLETSLRVDPPRVLGDVVQLQQVILNVLINAVEAMTDEASPRELRVETETREAGLLTITVRDSGAAVPAAELEHIFERFVTSKPEGLGMGLSISRSIITAHGGRMWATRNPERGLTMHIELPCLEDEADAHAS